MTLAAYMDRKKLSDEEIALNVGVSRVSISRVHRGLQQPSLELMRRLAEFTGGAVMPNDFLDQ